MCRTAVGGLWRSPVCCGRRCWRQSLWAQVPMVYADSYSLKWRRMRFGRAIVALLEGFHMAAEADPGAVCCSQLLWEVLRQLSAEPVFVNVYGGQESIPMDRCGLADRYDKYGCRTGPLCWESIPGLLKRSTNTGSAGCVASRLR